MGEKIKYDCVQELVDYILYCGMPGEYRGGVMERLDPVIELLYINYLTQTKPVSAITADDLAGLGS